MESTGMQTNEDPLRRKLPATVQATLIAALLIIFLFLHVLAGAVLQRAGAPDGTHSKERTTLRPYD